MKSKLQEKAEILIAVFLIAKNISGCKMRFIAGLILIIISILITLIVAFIAMTSVDDMGEEENEL